MRRAFQRRMLPHSLAMALSLPLAGYVQAQEVEFDKSRQLLHRKVLDRLDDVLGPAADIFTTAGVERMTLPWLLYVTYVQRPEQESTELADLETGKELLNPLPAERRRRGLLSIGGGIATILAMIEFAREGCTREDPTMKPLRQPAML